MTSYSKPDVDSSFSANNLGESIYSCVKLFRPTCVIELGALGGYSSISILQALSSFQHDAQLFTYDLFEDYPYNNISQDKYISNLARHSHTYDQSIKHTIQKLDVISNINQIIERHKFRDPSRTMLFVDISNTADNLSLIFDANIYSFPVLFEGGTKERDNVEWMIKYNKTPISFLCQGSHAYTIVDHSFPGLSLYCPKIEGHSRGL
jgi:hypothetical protein